MMSLDLKLGNSLILRTLQDASTAARLRRMGLGLLTPRAGLAALSEVLAGPALSGGRARGAAVVAAVPIHWERFLANAELQSELFAEFSTAQRALVSANFTAAGDSTHPPNVQPEFGVIAAARVRLTVKVTVGVRLTLTLTTTNTLTSIETDRIASSTCE